MLEEPEMNLSISGVCRSKDLVESITVAWMLARLYGRRGNG